MVVGVMGRSDGAEREPAAPADPAGEAGRPGGKVRRITPTGRWIAAAAAVAVVAGLALHTPIPVAYMLAGHHAGRRSADSAGDPGSEAGRPESARATAAQLVRPVPIGDASPAKVAQDGAFSQIILPDLLIVAPMGLTPRQIARLHAIKGIRSMITFDGAEITAGGRPVSVIGVNPDTFRSWVPLGTASDQAVWSALARGEFVASQAAAARLRLRAGDYYDLVGATAQATRFGAAAKLGVAGVDLLVNQATSAKLGLVRQVAGLISAPAMSLQALTSKVASVLGPTGKMETLRSQKLPVASVPPGSRPSNYLELFKASAAEYCPGLSWTVLAAIGQIESADGANIGPSIAGAMGPMQFLPSTWAAWGIDGFGETGPPDVLNPYDAVPSAARLLCADGAAAGGQSLYNAVFDYNHANWYVNEVLSLAAEYAADYQ
jgi:hypothetical protein